MTILEKDVLVRVKGSNAKCFEQLGYVVPKNKGRVKHGTTILVKIDDLPLNSNAMVRFICDYCNGVNQIEEKDNFKPYYKLINGRNKVNKDCCGNEECMSKKRWESIKENIPKGKSLGESYPHLINEWSDKNTKTPFDYFQKSDEIVWWHCVDCGSDYDMMIKNRTYHKCSCPYCSGNRVNHTNCLWTTHPEVAKLLKTPQRGYEINAGKNGKEDFICPNCGNNESKWIQTVVRHGLSCRRCSDGISYPEKFILNMLLQLNLKVEKQKIFDWSKNIQHENSLLCGDKKYDFYLTDINCVIEAHGEQHYYDKNRHFRKNMKDEAVNDILKENLALDNGIKHYISINCSISDPDFIKDNLMNSELNKLFCLSNIDWKECHSYAVTSLVKPTCELWMKLKNIKEVANKIHLDIVTVRRYLIQGSKLGFCDYNPQQEAEKTRRENLVKALQTRLVKVVQLTDDGKFIREWESATQAQKELNINNIPTVCRGRQDTAGGFKWMYKSDYDKLLNVKGEVKFSTKQRIVKLTLDGEFIEEYKKIGDAAKSVGVKSSNISSIKTSCDNNRRTAYGFRWMYKDDYMKLNEIINNK